MAEQTWPTRRDVLQGAGALTIGAIEFAARQRPPAIPIARCVSWCRSRRVAPAT